MQRARFGAARVDAMCGSIDDDVARSSLRCGIRRAAILRRVAALSHLTVLERRLALFDERAHAFLLVLEPECRVELASLE
jgi:hypothetical protein